MNRHRLSGCLRPMAGFTLLETLIALAILAITLSAAFRAIGVAANNSGELRNRLLAEWVAQNKLAEHRALGQWINAGLADGEVEQGGQRFRYQEEIKATPNPLFRRIDIKVYLLGSDSQLTSMTGFISIGQQ